MKHAENVDVTTWLDQVGDAVVVIEEDANFARPLGFVTVPEAWMVFE